MIREWSGKMMALGRDLRQRVPAHSSSTAERRQLGDIHMSVAALNAEGDCKNNPAAFAAMPLSLEGLWRYGAPLWEFRFLEKGGGQKNPPISSRWEHVQKCRLLSTKCKKFFMRMVGSAAGILTADYMRY
jgi:hypothetical protein